MIRKLARPMLASVYIADGVSSFSKSSEHASGAENALSQVKGLLPAQYAKFIPSDPETAVKINAGLKVGAGSAFALGKMPRVAAGLLAGSTVATMVSRNAFWNAKDADEQARQRTGALTNVALLGGVLLASQDTAGKPGLAWRAQDASKRAKKNIQSALPGQSETEKALGKAGDWFSDTAETVSKQTKVAAGQVADYVDDNKDDWKKTASKLADRAQDFAEDATDWATDKYDELKPNKYEQYKMKKQAKGFIGDFQDNVEDKYNDLKPSKLEKAKAKHKAKGFVGDFQDNLEDTFSDLKPSKLDKFKAKRKVNSVVGDLQDNLDDLGPSDWEKFKTKKKVNKKVSKLQDDAQDAIDNLQDAFDDLDASPSWWQKRKAKKKINKAEKRAQKAVKKVEKKFK